MEKVLEDPLSLIESKCITHIQATITAVQFSVEVSLMCASSTGDVFLSPIREGEACGRQKSDTFLGATVQLPSCIVLGKELASFVDYISTHVVTSKHAVKLHRLTPSLFLPFSVPFSLSCDIHMDTFPLTYTPYFNSLSPFTPYIQPPSLLFLPRLVSPYPTRKVRNWCRFS